MVASMTAFARLEDSGEWGQAVWEVRTVNHRYLDISMRLPENLRVMEPTVRERVSARLNRGKVDCNLRYETSSTAEDVFVNAELAKKLIRAADELDVENPTVISRFDVLRWPGVMDKKTPDLERLSGPVLRLLDNALDVIVDDRYREGGEIKKMIEKRCELSLGQLERVRNKMPDIINAARERCLSRARELDVELDNDRLEQEIVLLSQKLDVEEELDRLEAHVHEVKRVLNETAPIGRRLDFLMQEINRETNTLGSKSAHIDTSNASIELKVLTEQMREQIQNVE